MNEETASTPLGQVIEIIMGQAPSSKDCNLHGKGTPFVKVGEFGERRPIIREWTTNPIRMARRSDVLLCVVGATCGKINLGEDCAIGRSVAALRPYPLRLDQHYLYYFMLTLVERLRSGSLGAAQTVISKGMVENIYITIPPLFEQHRIVAILDEAFASIATAKSNAEKNVQNARAIFESHLESGLRNKTWEWKTLRDLCIDVEYGSSAKSKKEGSVPVIRMGNIQDGQLDWGRMVYTDDKDEIKKYLLKDNDVLFNRTNSPELVGKTAIYRGEMPAIFASYLIRIHRKEDLLDAEFLCYFLNSQIAVDYGKSVVISSVNQANINGTKLKNYPIPAPSLPDQKAIVATLNELSKETRRLVGVYERKIAALDDLKKSLLNCAIAGELTAGETTELIEAVA